MEYTRGLGVQGRELQLLIELTEDKLLGAPSVGGLPESSCIPESARCGPDGNSSLPGFRAILLRAIQSAVSDVENRIKLSLYPKRKTNFAQSPKEVYEDRVKYGTGELYSFINDTYLAYPTWNDLNEEQQSMFNDDPAMYTDGTLPWDLLTPEQAREFSGNVIYVPNKVEDEEKIDGRERSYIKLYERQIIDIHRISFKIVDPMGLGQPYLHRSFDKSEYFLYKKEGAVMLFPAQAKISAVGQGGLMTWHGFGLKAPRYAQVIHIDYSFGLEKIPYALQEAVALLAAVRAMQQINIAYTQGMMSYSVSGFSASFGEGMFSKVIEQYKEDAERLLAAFYMPVLTAW